MPEMAEYPPMMKVGLRAKVRGCVSCGGGFLRVVAESPEIINGSLGIAENQARGENSTHKRIAQKDKMTHP